MQDLFVEASRDDMVDILGDELRNTLAPIQNVQLLFKTFPQELRLAPCILMTR